MSSKNMSPMMQEYCKTKEQYKDCILFYRLGDFYEMFFDDALLVTKELEITLTGKDCGLEERAPMCGVPYHAAETYINRLIERGHKVAICEQVEDPKKAKGLVKREVVRIVTPGTTLDAAALDETKNNYLMSIVSMEEHFGCAIADITTGDCFLTEVDKPQKLLDEINKFVPAEIICNDSFYMSNIDTDDLQNRLGICVFSLDSWYFDDELCRRTLKDHFHVGSLDGLGVGDYDCGIIAAGALFLYLKETQKTALSHMATIRPYAAEKYMLIDSSSRRNLELVETLREKQKRGSLLWVLDKTKTAMGARTLRSYVEQPLIDRDEIEERLEALEELNKNGMLRDEIREYLGPVYDLERLISRISYKSANPRDLIAFASSLEMLPYIKQVLKEFKTPLLQKIYEDMDSLEDVTDLIKRAIVEDPPLAQKDGGIIKEGYNEDVDKFRRSRTDGKKWLSELEARERERTGIKTMKIKYNRVFGYFIEIPNGSKNLVKDEYHWERRQTLTNCERYISPELKEKESMILNAEENIIDLEYKIFCDIKNKVKQEVPHLNATADVLGELDALVSLSACSEEYNLVRPNITDEHIIDIKNGRHPVVEVVSKLEYVPNDCELDNGVNTLLITGPNMSGKSTFMRQLAIIVIMAQMGSFVPCESATLPIIDKIFTRIGASDDLVSGESTFMVEMKEARNAIHNATANSLILFDELGRGTATYDGMSLAQAILEYISDNIKSFTLFSTHYHELTRLDKKYKNIKNVHVSAVENGNEITFLHKVKNGAVDKSYGIHVARLAKMPDSLLKRADEILNEYESNAKKKNPEEKIQLTMDFETNVKKDDIIKETIENIDVLNTTPMEALNVLFDLKQKIKKGE